MGRNRPLYEFMYHSLLTQIKCGYLRYGDPLPSQPQLCRQYHVGITTVRRVVEMLGREGYVRFVPGRPAAVIFQTSPEECALHLCLLYTSRCV